MDAHAQLNIVVVEDNDDLREATVEALMLEGHKVTGLDCAEALPEQASWQAIDLMVVDLNLPGEDGLALTRRVRAMQPGIGIIMVTARDLPSDKQRGYATGADIYIPKPAALEELSSAIQALARRLNPQSQEITSATLDTARHMLQCNALQAVQSSPQEAALLTAFCRVADCRIETWQLIEVLEKDRAEDPKAALEILIVRLRKKLQQAGCCQVTIKAIRNWGYQMTGHLLLV